MNKVSLLLVEFLSCKWGLNSIAGLTRKAMSERIIPMKSGVVKFFDEKKGYGFIISDEDDSEIFVHFSNINIEGFKKLRKGQHVNFDIRQAQKGFEAIDVTPTD